MIKDNGPAFPMGANEYAGHGPVWGISTRDYFAAKAMQGLLAHPLGREPARGQSVVEAHAIAAYEYADAMLAARERE